MGAGLKDCGLEGGWVRRVRLERAGPTNSPGRESRGGGGSFLCVWDEADE